MKPPPPTTGLSATFIATPRPRAAGMLLTLAAILLLPHSTLALGINPDPGSGEVSSFAITRTVPGGTIHDPLVPLPGSEAYELSPDRTGKVSLTLSITHTFQGTITTTVRGSDGASITSVPGDNPTLTFYPLKDRYPFVITVLSPTGVPFFTRLIVPQELSSALGPGFTGNSYNHDFNIEQEYEYRIPQEDDSGDYGIGGKDVASGACGSCQSSCDLTHGSETANADTASGNGRFLAGFSAGISMQGDSSTGVDVDIDPAVGVSRSSFKSHGTGDATINRNIISGVLNTITTGSAHTKFENMTDGVKVLISKTPSDSEFRTITFVNTDTNEITRTSTFGGKSVETVWSYDDTGDDPTWTITMGNGACKAVLIREDDGSNPNLRLQRRELYERADDPTVVEPILVSQVRETHTKTILGWRKTKSEVMGASGGPLTTLWEYFGPADGTVKAGLLKSVTRPDGATETHDYYISGYNYHIITRPFAGGGQMTERRYKPTSGTPSFLDQRVGSHYLSQRYDTWSSTGMTRYQHDGTAYRATSHTITPLGTDFGGTPSSVTMPDGTRITQSPNRNGGMRNLTVERGSPGTTGVGEGTSTHTIRNKDGIIEAKTVTAIGGDADGAVLDQFTVTLPTSDTVGRPTEIKYFGGAPTGWTINRSYACCGLASETDNFGIPTFYQHDDLGRRIRVNYLGVTKATVYDGLTASTHRYPEDASDGIWSGIPSDTNKIFSTTRNLAGTVRTNESPDPSALDNEGIGIPGELTATTTTITHSSTGTASETDIPGIGSQTTYTHPDGRFWKTTGTLAPQRINAYAVNSTGLVSATAYLIQDGASPVIAEATATQSDRAGRTVAKGIIPDLVHATLMAVNHTTGGTLTHATRQLYNDLGQVEITTDADGVNTLFTYNDKGERLLTVVDLNNNYDPEESIESAIDYGTDQITRTMTFATNRPGSPAIPVIRTETHVWQDNAAENSPTLVSYNERTPNGLESWSWQIGYGETLMTTPYGLTRVETTTLPDDTYTLSTYSGGMLHTVESFDSDDILITSLTYDYDDLNRLFTTLDSRTGTTTTAYLSATADFVVGVTDDGNRETLYAYDYRGRQTTVTLPDTTQTNIIHTTYTPRGETEARWGSQTYPEFRTYDYAGRPKTLRTKPDFDQGIPVNTGGSLTTWNYYPDTGLLNEKLDHDSKGPKYTYTAAGRLETRDWARYVPNTTTRVRTTYGYTHGRLTCVTYNDTITPNLVYTHDTLGRVRAVTRGGSIHAEYVFDPDTLRLITEKLNLDTHARHLHRHYGDHSRPLSLDLAITTGTSQYTTGYGYDNAGRLQHVWHHPSLHSTTKAPTGDPTFTYSYTYTQTNPGDLRVGTTSGQGLKQDFMPYTVTRNAVGQNPALTANRTYEGTRDALRTIENKAGTSVVSSYTYAVNSLGQRTGVVTAGSAFAGTPADWDWDYDSLGQLDYAEHATTQASHRVYEYDSIGNRKKTAHGTLDLPVNDNYTANALNQYSLVPSYTPTPVHDADGNLTRGPVPGSNGNNAGVQAPADATLIKWDGENRMISCTIGSSTYHFEYDHLSRLVTRKSGTTAIRRYHYDGWNRIAEYSGAGTILIDTFTWGLDLSGTMQGAGGVGGLLATRWVATSGSPDYFPAYDGNGNVGEYLTTAGAVTVHYEYDPFGSLTRRTGDSSVRFQYRFSTKPRDFNTGLYYYGYRWYDPVTGRWPSRDPIGERGGVNLYGFVGNRSTHKIDMLGLSYSFEFILDEYFTKYPDINKEQKKWAETTLADGCVGATSIYLGNKPKRNNCFKTMEQAIAKQTELNQRRGCCAQVYSIHFHNDGGKTPDVTFDPDTGKADLDNWDQSRKPGKNSKGNDWINYDYGFLLPEQVILHASKYHNPPHPDNPTRGKYHREEKLNIAKYYISSICLWKESNNDFNEEVWCAECIGNRGGPKPTNP